MVPLSGHILGGGGEVGGRRTLLFAIFASLPGNWVSGILSSDASNNFRNAFHGRKSSLRKSFLNISKEIMPLRWGLVQGLVSNAK